MNRDDIIRMALEHFGAVLKSSDLEVKLAALAVTKEREACAEVCENLYGDDYESGGYACGDWPTPEMCAAAIRARGEA